MEINFNQWFNKRYKKIWMLLIYSLILSGIILIVGRISLFIEIEQKILDVRFRLCPIPSSADSNIIMVAIDDNSLKYAREFNQGWPFPREFYGVITSYLNNDGAKAIIFDMQFDEHDFDRNDFSAEQSDNNFAQAMGNSKTYIGAQLGPDKTDIPPSLTKHAIMFKDRSITCKSYNGGNIPIEMFVKNAAGVGITNLSEDREAIVHRIPLFYKLKNSYYPSLALCVWLNESIPNKISSTQKELIIKTRDGQVCSIPYSYNSEYSLNWYGKGGDGEVFKYIPFKQLLQSAVASQYGGEPILKQGYFKSKYVIIGATAGGLMDLKSSPYSWAIPGMEIWATMLSNLLHHDYVKFLPEYANLWLSFLLCFIVILCGTRLSGGKASMIIGLVLILVILSSWATFYFSRLVLPSLLMVLSIIVSWLFILTIGYMMEGRHKKELRQIFTRYLHPDLVKRIVDNPELVQMGGEELHATVMFSDIYNFTGFSEQQTPKQLVSYLNDYFSTFTNSILDHHGLLDKYTGDGLMAVFGIPIARTDHALLACQAAISHRDYSLQLKNKGKELSPSEYFHLNTRLGINSGQLVAGNIGSERRMEYTSIGDTVNLSARLEGVNKIYHTNIIISQSTWELVKDQMLCRELDYLRVKGKKEPTKIFELLCNIKDATDTLSTLIKDYHSALVLYRQGEFESAVKIFQNLAGDPFHDLPSKTMKERCDYLIQNPPHDWDGILTLETK